MSNEITKGKIAFTVVLDDTGYYHIVSAGSPVEVERQASLLDIKAACREIQDAIYRKDIANTVAAILLKKEQESVVVTPAEEETSTPEAQ